MILKLESFKNEILVTNNTYLLLNRLHKTPKYHMINNETLIFQEKAVMFPFHCPLLVSEAFLISPTRQIQGVGRKEQPRSGAREKPDWLALGPLKGVTDI